VTAPKPLIVWKESTLRSSENLLDLLQNVASPHRDAPAAVADSPDDALIFVGDEPRGS
jgi:hypothetical protein